MCFNIFSKIMELYGMEEYQALDTQAGLFKRKRSLVVDMGFVENKNITSLLLKYLFNYLFIDMIYL